MCIKSLVGSRSSACQKLAGRVVLTVVGVALDPAMVNSNKLIVKIGLTEND
jgi:hypothetical protein